MALRGSELQAEHTRLKGRPANTRRHCPRLGGWQARGEQVECRLPLDRLSQHEVQSIPHGPLLRARPAAARTEALDRRARCWDGAHRPGELSLRRVEDRRTKE